MNTRRKRRDERKRRQQRSTPKRTGAALGELKEAEEADRLAYSRRQAAEALGVSISTIDRRVVPSVSTVKTPWGQRLIPVAEVERFLREHLERPRGSRERGTAGRPPALPRQIVDRIRLEYARGRALAEIARALNEDRVSRPPTAVASGGPRRCALFSSAPVCCPRPRSVVWKRSEPPLLRSIDAPQSTGSASRCTLARGGLARPLVCLIHRARLVRCGTRVDADSGRMQLG
jgi:hypothetical protein